MHHETELKYRIPDAATWERLASLSEIGGCTLSESEATDVHDVYYDTAGRHIEVAGWAFRMRSASGRILATLKRLKSESRRFHRREEVEAFVDSVTVVTDWPESPLKNLLLEVSGGEPLESLVEIHQVRTTRNVFRQRRVLAEWSIDEVRLRVGDKTEKLLELEIELKNGSEEELHDLDDHLRQEVGLEPTETSKFEMATRLLTED